MWSPFFALPGFVAIFSFGSISRWGVGTLESRRFGCQPFARIRGMPADHYLVLSALGADRPGLVAEVTDYLAERGVNVEDSRMAVLGAEFGIQMLVSGSEQAIARVVDDKGLLEAKTKLGILVRRTKSPEEHRRAAVIPCVVTAEAIDHEGIVRAVALA